MTMLLSQDEFIKAIDQLYNDAIAEGQHAAEEKGAPDGMDLEAAREYYLSSMPMLSSRRSVQLYIALTAYGRQTNLLDPADAKRCLYVAQLALSAFGGRSSDPEPPPYRGVASEAAI